MERARRALDGMGAETREDREYSIASCEAPSTRPSSSTSATPPFFRIFATASRSTATLRFHVTPLARSSASSCTRSIGRSSTSSPGWSLTGTGILATAHQCQLCQRGRIALRAVTPGTPAWYPGTRRRCPIPTRTCSWQRAFLPARGFTTSTRSWRHSVDGVPDNMLLSHDLFEATARARAFVCDIEFVDDYPTSVLTHARRHHRWILRRLANPVLAVFPGAVPSWPQEKSAAGDRALEDPRQPETQPCAPRAARDARRRLGVPAGSVVVLDDGHAHRHRVAAVAASRAFAHRSGRAQSLQVFWRNLRDDTAIALGQIMLVLAFLPYHAWEASHAVVLTLVRLTVTHRRLLEWETAAVSSRGPPGSRTPGPPPVRDRHGGEPDQCGWNRRSAPGRGPSALLTAAPFLLLWAGAPGIGYWLSLPIGALQRPLVDADRRLFRLTARQTWSFFEAFVTADDAWLPPHNYQEAGVAAPLARRTSPTNIAMYLLSSSPRTDLSYLSTTALLERVDNTLTTLDGLQKFRGHPLNRYSTASRSPLMPQDVSTVDSGNLAGALITLAQALLQLVDSPQTQLQRLESVVDTADAFGASCSSPVRRRRPTARSSPRSHAPSPTKRMPPSPPGTRPRSKPSARLCPASRWRSSQGPMIPAATRVLARRPAEGGGGGSRYPERRRGRRGPGSRPSDFQAGGCDRFHVPVRPPPASVHHWLPAARGGPGRPTTPFTTCWRRKPGSPASWRLPSTRCASTTGFSSAGSSRACMAARR